MGISIVAALKKREGKIPVEHLLLSFLRKYEHLASTLSLYVR